MSGTIPNQFKSTTTTTKRFTNDEDDEEEEEEEEEEVDEGEDEEERSCASGSTSTRPGSYNNDENSSRTSLMSRSGGGGPASNCVQVALRIRPLLPREVIANARECISVTPGEPQVWIAGTHAFTYDYVFSTNAPQDDIFCNVAKPLVDGILQGYNATILAYGQTGSGKTYTMGTGFDPAASTHQLSTNTGLLPRCISYLFAQMNQLSRTFSPPPDFKVCVQFTELYNEEVIDLLSDAPPRPGTARPSSNNVKIHEQANGQIYLVNITTKQVQSDSDTLETLRMGALNRTTASTNMNDSSSRSHAIFSIMVTQNRVICEKNGERDIETLHGKFHFVDLAGSERLKRTLATGERAREGIAINSGLLALGNVISALGDKSKKASHVPYRDSKLTRLLQDSLGGNSRTLMIACVSPNELDFVETLNTMKYANRAKNIKNKVVLNQDKSSRTISLLRDEIARLQAELNEYKRGMKSEYDCGDVNAENMMLLAEVETLRCKVKSKQDCIDQLTSQVARLQACKISSEVEGGQGSCDLTDMVTKYLREIEELRAKLYESEMECEKLRGKQRVIMRNLTSPRESSSGGVVASVSVLDSVNDLLNKAKQEVSAAAQETRRHTQEHQNNNSGESAENSDDDEEEEDESEQEQQQLQQQNYSELANLTQEINTKQRLIEELENSQLRLESLKNKYEEKISQLGQKIRCTEEERDLVLRNTTAQDKTKEYEVKIANLQAELKKWGNAKREHAKLMRNQTHYESQINKLKNEVDEMKRIKVRLMNQVKADNQKFREVEKQRMREITQLRKESRMKEIRVRKLESDSRLKDQVLKRKLQEVEMLKRSNTNKGGRKTQQSPVKGKQVWGRIQGMIVKDVSQRQSCASMEREMVGLIARRAELTGMLEGGEGDREFDDSIRANLAVIEDKIREVQDEIVRNGDAGNKSVGSMVGGLAGRDMGYLVEKLFEQSVQGLSDVQQLEGRVREVEEVNKHLTTEVDTLRDLLQHMYRYQQAESAERQQQQQQTQQSMMMPPPAAPPPSQSGMKARRRLTSTTSELLGSTESIDNLENPMLNRTFTRNTRLTQSMRDSGGGTNNSSSNNVSNNNRRRLTRQDTYNIDNNLDRTFLVDGGGEQQTQNTTTTANAVPLMQRSFSEVLEAIPNQTNIPVVATNHRRKSPRSNAWLQLTRSLEGHSKQILCLSATESTLISGSKDGSCRVWDLETSKCVMMFDGHPHNVSCVCHVEESSLVLTGSSYQLRACDLRSGEIVKIMSSSGQQLPATSSTLQPVPPIPSLPQTTTLPRVNDLPPGEKSIYSIQQIRNYFFTSFGERIKIWDLRKLASIGTLAGKHNASVMCLSGKPSGLRNNDWLISGSKDHTLKIYEYEHNTPPEQITSIRNLLPPHYDGIETIYLHGDRNVYSGSRDTCIKKWDLGAMSMVGSVTNAHSGWVTGLCGVPGGGNGVDSNTKSEGEFLVSCSRDGTLKLWDCGRNDFREVCRYESSVGLECVAQNSRFLFFGGGATSTSGTVLCCSVNERALLPQQQHVSQIPIASSASSQQRSSSPRLNLISPMSSPKFRRKLNNHHSNLLHHHQHHGSIDNIMTSSGSSSSSDSCTLGVYRISENFCKSLWSGVNANARRGGTANTTNNNNNGFF